MNHDGDAFVSWHATIIYLLTTETLPLSYYLEEERKEYEEEEKRGQEEKEEKEEDYRLYNYC